MLAGILLNLPVGRTGPKIKRKCPRDGIINGRFIMVEGYQIDTQDRPEKEIVKRVAKALAKIKLPKEVRTEARTLSKLLLDARYGQSAQCGIRTRANDIIAYRRLAEILKVYVAETEEAALLLLLLEL